MGLGLFGGGVAVARHLVGAGARVLVTDLRDERALAESLDAIAGLRVELRLGEHRACDFESADVVVANPAVAPSSPFLALARSAGARITSELELFVAACPARQVVAVTGTNGKSTTATLIGDMLRCAGRTVHVGGNIGRSLLDGLERIAPDDAVVLEVSSYQLEVLDPGRPWPEVAVATAISPDHLERHGSMEAYVAAKRRLFELQGEGGVAILNAGDPRVAAFAGATRARVRRFSRLRTDLEYVVAPRGGAPWLVERLGAETPLAEASSLRIPGDFHRDNALAAAAAARALAAGADAVATALRAFRGIAHRLQPLPPVGGVRVFDNAVSTVPESTCSAIGAVTGPVRLIAGGKSKGLDLGALAKAIAERVVRCYAYGSAAAELAAAARAAGADAVVHPTLRSAFAAALADARPGEALLYSPAFPSHDQYRNFLDRGSEFLGLVAAARESRGEGAGDVASASVERP